MSVRHLIIIAAGSWLPRVLGAWAVLSGLLQLARAARRGRRAEPPWNALAGGARSVLAGVLLSSEAVGAIYFLIAGWWWAVDGFRRRRAGTS
ncbi:DUF308 domain-containing protein [Burkholderia gladioli]|uniref:DUF308 domain-containing protein n=1 Tax=Burkholderia gladioli TaxID=28095 RepID=A0AB38TYL5_BURGA|nr:DUF308 domain-containing protein [Burkholderia gladioli]MBU9682678.1 DUF308 domain-containing protein [Burkholderia gladioli]PRG99680.1 hypothetical protein C6V08_15965 [Burkholderia gladioli]UWX72772.1 DUF308 domain-containing protein [Burkholderia gladioli]